MTLREIWNTIYWKAMEIKEKLDEASSLYPYRISNNATLQADIYKIIEKYSSVPPEHTQIRDVNNGYFKQCEIIIYAQPDDEKVTYARIAFQNAINKALLLEAPAYGLAYVFHDYKGDLLHLLTAYYATTKLQRRRLEEWYNRKIQQERDQIIAVTKSIKDPQLERDMQGDITHIVKHPSSDGRILIRAGYFFDPEERIRSFLSIDLSKNPHWLLVGRSGSGKSVLMQYLLYTLLDYNLIVYICDPKGSGDFRGITSNYAEYDDCTEMIEQAYKKYQDIKVNQTGERMILICDEYPAYILYLEGKDKKKAQEIKNMIAEMLMQGRSLPGGGSAAVWILAQRADAEYFPKGARLNFKVIIALGKLDTQSQSMLFPGEELPKYPEQIGMGLIWVDGKPIRIIQTPYIDTDKILPILRRKGQAW